MSIVIITDTHHRILLQNEFGIVAVVSEAKITVEDPFHEHIQPASNRPDLIMVSIWMFNHLAGKKT